MERHVSISKGNSKMGTISSVSLPAGLTCRECACKTKCYAMKIERLRPNVRSAYANNMIILQEDPAKYWREVEAAIMMSRFFRFHVSGDIPDMTYFTFMVTLAKRNKHCCMLCFTKRYEIINEFIKAYGELPVNLQIVFSGWPGLDMKNEFHLPEAHVRFRDGSTTASTGAIECSGNCTECAATDMGCWTLKKGQQVIFDEH